MQDVQMIPLIKCCYGTPCFISVEDMVVPETETPQTVLKLDFNIKKYKALVRYQGWGEHDFPENIVINDKLYLDEKLKDQLIEVLDAFIKDGWLQNIAQETTNRGFALVDMKDLMGNTISFQDSSAASEAFIWFGCKTNDKVFVDVNGKLEKFKFPDGDSLVEDRLHINKKKARELKKIIKEVWKKHMDLNKPSKKKPKMN